VFHPHGTLTAPVTSLPTCPATNARRERPDKSGPAVVTVTDPKLAKALREERMFDAGSEPSAELKALFKRMMRPQEIQHERPL
jgi:hypothetical protein